MELAIPLIALGGLYIASNQSSKNETFRNRAEGLPNTDIPDRNYPIDQSYEDPERDLTAKLSTVNRYDGGQAYTDKYFNQDMNSAHTDTLSAAAQYKSLTGNTVDSDYFRHNNMQPYFGSHIRGRADPNMSETIMDNYTGSGSQITSKREQAPLFGPGENVQYAYGTPNNSDFYQSRVNPSLRMANVKPFEEIQVAPGLGLGYTADGNGGFNSGMAMRDQWLDKSVDELRVANKQKASGLVMLGHEGPANSFIKTMGELGQMNKNRVDTSYEVGSDRYMTTTGLEKGPTMRAIPNDRFTNRPETAASYIGAAGSSNPAQYVDGEYMESKHIDLGALPFNPAYASGKGGGTEADYEMKAKTAYPNNRTENVQDGYFGIFSGGLGAVVAPLLDMLRPSRRENTIGNLRPYQNAKPAVGASYIFNPADRLAPTIRETTENSKFHLNVNARQGADGYRVTGNQPINNQRDTTTDYYYAGNASAGTNARQARTYDAEYNQRNNDIKSSTIQGYMVKGNMSLMNGDINMQGKAKDVYLANNRAVMASMPGEIPSMNSMGQVQGQAGLYQNIQLDRNSSDIMSALKSNPYSLDMRGGI